MRRRYPGLQARSAGRGDSSRRASLLLLGLCAVSLAGTLTALAQEGGGQSSGPDMVSPPVTPFVVDVDLRDLPAPPEWTPGMPVREVPRREFHPLQAVEIARAFESAGVDYLF